jgi:ubiquinone biosynthesis protein
MLKQRLIPTALVGPTERPAIRLVAVKPPTRLATFRLLLRLIGFGFALFWAARVRRVALTVIAQRVHVFLEDLGGLWIKAGQLMAMRVDLLPREITDELSNLQYRADGFAFPIARPIVERTIGRPLAEVFDQFEEQPFAAASISQEHRAHLRAENVWVVVKVQRPGIRAIFDRDFRLINWLFKVWGLSPRLSFMRLDGLLRELRQMMNEELTYSYEIGNLRRMRKLLREHNVYVPRVFTSYCGPHVITMEEISGVVMSDYLRMTQTDPDRVTRWCEENRIKPRRVGERLMFTFYRQLFEDNLFHGDLHPGNIILLRNSRFALIDFGTIGNLELRFVKAYREVARATAMKDYTKAVELYLLMCDRVPAVDLVAMRTDMVESYRAWEARAHAYGTTYMDKAISGAMATDIQNIAARYRVNPSWQYLRVGRAIATMDANLNVLLGDANPVKILKRYFAEAQQRAVRHATRNIGANVANATAEVFGLVDSAGTLMRRSAIQIEGIQTTGRYLIGLVLTGLKIFLAVGLFLLAYDFLRHYHPGAIAGLDKLLGSHAADLAAAIPTYAYSVSLLIMLALVLILIIVYKAARHAAQPKVRLPNGDLADQ